MRRTRRTAAVLLTALLTVLLTVLPLSGCGAAGRAADGGDGVADSGGNGVPTEDREVREVREAHGFTLRERDRIGSIDADLEVWEHGRTGAEVWCILNDDPERAFAMIFRTEPDDETGKFHVLEHASCSASEKYPGGDVFFDLDAHGFLTDLNAGTYQSATSYYFSTLSEDQLLTGASFFLDCAFHSAIRDEPMYLRREGWRYELSGPDAPLEVKGIVYNEMLGTYSGGDDQARHAALSALFPDSFRGFESGGLPDQIPGLSYEDAIEAYETWYRPSNCTIMLYGDLDPDRFLASFDEEALSGLGREEVPERAPEAAPLEERAVVRVDVPAGSGAGTVLLAYALPGLSYAEGLLMDIGAECLLDPSCPFLDELYRSGIAAGCDAYLDLAGDTPVFWFEAWDADPSDAERFADLVGRELRKICRHGFDRETVESVFQSKRLEEALARNGAGIGIEWADRMARMVMTGDESVLRPAEGLEAARAQRGRLEELFRDRILESSNCVLTAASPAPGLLDEAAQERAARLEAVRDAMSAEEVRALIEETAAYHAWEDGAGTVPSTLAALVTEDAGDIDAEIGSYPYTWEEREGVHVCSVDVEGDVSLFRFLFDVGHLDTEEIHALAEYLYLYGLSTEERDGIDVGLASRRLLYDDSASLSILETEDGPRPFADLRFYAPDEDAEEAMDLAFDLLLHVDLDWEADNVWQSLWESWYAYSDAEGLLTAAGDAALASTSRSARYWWEIGGIPHRDYLGRILDAEDDAYPDALDAVRRKAFRGDGAYVLHAGTPDEGVLTAMLSHVPERTGERDGTFLDLPSIPSRTAILMDTSSSYAYLGCDGTAVGVPASGALMLDMAVLQDLVYLPDLRLRLGAYGTDVYMNAGGTFLSDLYRGPGLTAFLDHAESAAEDLARILDGMDEADLNGYKLSEMSFQLQSQGPWNDAEDQFEHLMCGSPADARGRTARSIRSATLEDLRGSLDDVRTLFGSAGLAAVAPERAVRETAERFDQILDLR